MSPIVRRTDTNMNLLKRANLTTLHNRRLQDIAIMMFKAKNNLLPRNVQDPFITRVESKKGYTLRNSDFILPRFNSVKYGKHSLKYQGPLLCSKPTKEERDKNSLSAFKSILRKRELTILISYIGCENCLLCNS